MESLLTQRIHGLLKIRDMTQIELAAKAGIARSSLTEILKGNNSPNLSTLRRIADALGVSASYLIAEEDEVQLSSVMSVFPPDVQEFLLSQDALQYIGVAVRAKNAAITPEALEQIVTAIRAVRDVEKSRSG